MNNTPGQRRTNKNPLMTERLTPKYKVTVTYDALVRVSLSDSDIDNTMIPQRRPYAIFNSAQIR